MDGNNEPAAAAAAPVAAVPSQIDDKKSFSLDDYKGYIVPRTFTWAAIGGISGATSGYYAEGKLSLAFYNRAFYAYAGSLTFFSGAYAIKHLRQKDDVVNYAISGSVNGAAFFGAFRSVRRSAIGFAAGAAAGVLYHTVSVWMYETSRLAWIRSRRHTIRTSVDKTLVLKRPMKPHNVKRETFYLFGKPSDAASNSSASSTSVTAPSSDIVDINNSDDKNNKRT